MPHTIENHREPVRNSLIISIRRHCFMAQDAQPSKNAAFLGRAIWLESRRQSAWPQKFTTSLRWPKRRGWHPSVYRAFADESAFPDLTTVVGRFMAMA
jgi:hypothetical protein